jgi:DNA-binding NarL/FixJ family response regulator
MLRILLAEDHQLVRDGLRAILQREGMQTVDDVADGLQAVESATALAPDVAILDFDMPGLNGIDAARRIHGASPATRCILLTMYNETQYVLGALRAGILGYVVKTQAATELLEAIEVVRGGKIYLSHGISRAVVDAYLQHKELPGPQLTAREQMVLQLVAEGRSTREVATTLGISVKTVESHRSSIMGKLDIHEVATLVRYAIRTGVIRP